MSGKIPPLSLLLARMQTVALGPLVKWAYHLDPRIWVNSFIYRKHRTWGRSPFMTPTRASSCATSSRKEHRRLMVSRGLVFRRKQDGGGCLVILPMLPVRKIPPLS